MSATASTFAAMGCIWLIVLGGALEAVGFACIVAELARIQWREVGTPESLVRLRAWWQRFRAWCCRALQTLLRRPPVVKHGSASVGGGGTISIEGYGWQGMGPDVEDRLSAVERNLTTLHEQHKKATAKFDARLRTTAHDLGSMRSAIDQREQDRADERRSSLRGSVKLQTAATSFFIVGLGLSVWGSLTTC